MDRLRKVLCDPARLEIVQALSAGELCVNDLALAINRAPAATSQHLRVLRDAGIVSARRRGRAVIYSLAPGPMVEATVQVLDTAATIAAA